MAQRRAIYPTLDEARASFRMSAPAPSKKMGTGSRTPDDEIPQSVHQRRTTRRPTAMQLLQSTGDGSRGIQLPREMTREPVLQNRQGRSCLAAPSQEQGAGKTAELSDTSAANSLEILIARRSVSIQLHPQYRLVSAVSSSRVFDSCGLGRFSGRQFAVHLRAWAYLCEASLAQFAAPLRNLSDYAPFRCPRA
jgi:hypothetical protein